MSLFTRNIFKKLRTTYYINYPVTFNVVRLNQSHYYTCLCCKRFWELEDQRYKSIHNQLIHGKISDFSLFSIEEVRTKIKDVLTKFNIRKTSEECQQGFEWYQTLDYLNFIEFFELLEMEDSFYSWFKVMELNVCMLLFSLMKGTNKNSTVTKSIIQAMWIDVEKRMKLVEKSNKNFKDNVKLLYNKFQMTLFSYDEGFLSNDMVLASALWYHFFNKNCDDPRLLEVLVSYVRCQLFHLDSLDKSAALKTNQKYKIWLPLKPHMEMLNMNQVKAASNTE